MPRFRPHTVMVQIIGVVDDDTDDLRAVELQTVAIPYAGFGAWSGAGMVELLAQAQAQIDGAAEPATEPPAPNRAQRRAK